MVPNQVSAPRISKLETIISHLEYEHKMRLSIDATRRGETAEVMNNKKGQGARSTIRSTTPTSKFAPSRIWKKKQNALHYKVKDRFEIGATGIREAATNPKAGAQSTCDSAP